MPDPAPPWMNHVHLSLDHAPRPAAREGGTVDRFQYLLLMGACLAITLPLEWAFGARVWRRPARLLRALVPTVAVFYVWDVVAIDRAHWAFDPDYVTGWVMPLGVPLEELVFFAVIPVCALLSFESCANLLEPDRRSAIPWWGWWERRQRPVERV